MSLSETWSKYEPAIRALPADRPLTKEDLLTEPFRMESQGRLEMYYAPHHEYANRSAKVVLIGITPGWTQMRIAFQTAREGLERGLPAQEIARRTKSAARFAGAMRSNLVLMLNALELPQALGLASSDELFENADGLLHTTSVLKYPVFVDKQNYTGSRPALMATPFLRERALLSIRSELEGFRDALIIPLGRTVEAVLRELPQGDCPGTEQLLAGFPHPSGANGHRHRQLAEGADRMKAVIRRVLVRGVR
ncbi:hypothetical protein [Paenibacillus puerhi]|uniref:hypothetical protein n=1 Tax=Paenibacillus puerhi TaxID=2692622 RepID=UPI0013568B1A|nr:hypothetical protein [Paenibacillus puerhi]